MSNFIFVRHGESQANAQKRIAKPDSPLTEKGKQQAQKTASELINKKITKILCSPFLRAQQTAEIIASELGIPIDHIQVIDELQERRFLSREGKPKDHESEWYYTTEEDDAEPRIDLYNRMKTALSKIHEASGDGTVLVVGHACSGFYLLEIASGKNHFDDFKEAKQMDNADFIEMTL